MRNIARLPIRAGKVIATAAGLVLPVLGWSSGVVTNCNEAELRAAMVGGGTVTFACDGTITLASTIVTAGDVVLDGSGHQVSISGGGAVRVFYVQSGTTLTLIHLTIRGGRTPDGANGQGYAPGEPGGPGGGFYNAGTLILRDCIVTSNRTGNGGRGYTGPDWSSQYSAGGRGGAGGGIYNADFLVLSNSIVSGNSTGEGGVSGMSGLPDHYSLTSGEGGSGGGIYNLGTVQLENSTITGNTTGNGAYTPTFNPGANGGAGGAIWSGGTLTARGCTFSGNSTGYGGGGGANANMRGGGPGGTGGPGGAICSTGYLALTNCTFAGSSTGHGGNGGYGVYYGGSGGSGGPGGGIYSQTNNFFLLNCTIAINRTGSGGAGAHGSLGDGGPGPVGYGGGLGTASGPGQLLNNIIALNLGDTNAPDVWGAFSSLGYNLIGVTNGGSGFSAGGDLVGSSAGPLDPKLGPLANNGGLTFTLALLPGSPAIDAADMSAAPPTDQRGFPRPVGPAGDIGAYEYGSPALLRISQSSGSQVTIHVYGPQGQSCRLLTCTNLANWVGIGTNQIATDGEALFYDNLNSTDTCRFYRVALP